MATTLTLALHGKIFAKAFPTTAPTNRGEAYDMVLRVLMWDYPALNTKREEMDAYDWVVTDGRFCYVGKI
jgi:hypothetical protein